MEVAELAVHVPLWHALTPDDLPREGLDYFGFFGSDFDEVVVQVVETLFEAEEGFFQGDSEIVVEVVVDSLELRVRLLFHSEDNISRNHVWYLFSLSFEHYLVSVLHPLLHHYVQLLHIIDHLPAPAMRAVGFIDVASSAAPVALHLHLHLHSKAHLDALVDDPRPLALRTLLRLAVLGSRAPALGTVDVPSDRHVSRGSQVEVL